MCIRSEPPRSHLNTKIKPPKHSLSSGDAVVMLRVGTPADHHCVCVHTGARVRLIPHAINSLSQAVRAQPFLTLFL